jgi:hypothetical protein
MVSLREHMKGVLPWLVVRWAHGAGGGTIDFSPALATLDSPVHCIKSHFQKYFSEANSVFKTHGHTFIDISTRKA